MDIGLLFVGDVMLGRLVNQFLERAKPDYPWGNTLGVFRTADWKACNLECTISDRGVPWSVTPKAFHFRTDARNVAVLGAAGIDVVSLANNHILDFEYEAMADSVRILDAAGIGHAGAGANLLEASKPVIRAVKGVKIGFIAFTDNEPGWEARPESPGIFYLPIDASDERAKMLLRTVRETKARVGLLAVSAHWGPNWGYSPPPEHVRFARLLIDAGADIVFGHSGHVFRGIALYKGRPIMYCTGNFIDDYAVDEIERNDQSFIFVVETGAEKITRVLLYPTVIRDFQARLAMGDEADEIVSKMRQLCLELGTGAHWLPKERRLEIPVA